jgi:hypothetical protein
MGTLMQMPHGPAQSSLVLDQDEDLDDTGDYEDQLLSLMGRLEHQREGLALAVAARRQVQSLTRASEMMGYVSEFSGRHFPFAGPEMRDAMSRAAEFRAALEPLREPGHNFGDEAARQAVIQRCFTALCDALFAYFFAFTNRFPTSRAARGWVEVAATFIADLKRTVRDIGQNP